VITNERLRGSIASAGLRPAELAEAVRVDPKTVERWIARGRIPHRVHRVAVAKCLGVDEAYLWPELLTSPQTQSASVAELLQLFPTRVAVPQDLWRQLISGAREAFDVLFYAGTFMFEQYDMADSDVARPTYAELSAQHGIPETQVTNWLAAVRRDFRTIVLETIRDLSGSDEEFREDVLALLGIEAL